MNLPAQNKRIELLIDHFTNGSQNAFAEHIGVSQGTINRLFREDTRYNKIPNVTSATLKKVLITFPEISKEWLLTGKGEMFNKAQYKTTPPSAAVQEPLIGEGDVIRNKHGQEYKENKTGGYYVKVPVVPFPAYASFIEAFNDEFANYDEFESAYFDVDHIGRGKYIAFRVTNDSMHYKDIDGTPSGAEVLARELQRHHWKDGFKPSKYGFILVTKTGIMFKDIISDIDENGYILLHSRNPSPEYKDFQVHIDDVHSIFKVIKRTF